MPPTYPPSDHYSNGRFFNPGVREHGFRELLKWTTNREPGVWRKHIPSVPGPKPEARVEGGELRVTFIGHATVLIQTEGLNLLTDPVFSERVSPVSFAGPRRHRAPGIRFQDLPAIDVLLISHNHYDHLDLPTLKKLVKRGQPAVFCPLGVASILRRIGFQAVTELDWGQSAPFRHIQLHCVRAQHFAARTPFDRNRTLWCGWVAGFAAGNVYFAGDTGFGGFFEGIGERFRPIRLALLPIGAYRPEWFMGPVHMNPAHALEVHRAIGAQTSVAIHYGTFSLADDGETEPVDALAVCLAEARIAHPFLVLPEGEARVIPALGTF